MPLDLGYAHPEYHCVDENAQNLSDRFIEQIKILKSDITGISSKVLSVRCNASAMNVRVQVCSHATHLSVHQIFGSYRELRTGKVIQCGSGKSQVTSICQSLLLSM